MNPQPIGAFVIVTKGKTVLLGKRKNAYKANSYGCPGGRLELEESLIDCAKRELLEETNVKAIKLKYLGVIRELQGDYNFIHFVLQCTVYKGEISLAEPEKCETWNFYDVNKLPPNILSAHKAGIELLKNSCPTYVDIVEK